MAELDTQFFARELVGLIQPWDHDSNYELEPNSKMYVDRPPLRFVYDNGTEAPTSGPTSASDVDAVVGLWQVMSFIMFFFFLSILLMALQDGPLSRFCGRHPLLPHNSQHPLEGSNEEQNQMSEEQKERALQKQRQERRLWYTFYLKPFLITLKAQDFVEEDPTQPVDKKKCSCKPCGFEEENPSTDKKPEECHQVIDVDDLHEHELEANKTSASTGETPTKGNSRSDAATGQGTGLVSNPVGIQIPELEVSTKMMKIWDPRSKSHQEMEANCSICLLDYEEEDTIVRSGADEDEEICNHVFHLECMLEWLAHGRKRCPICRRWFVPGLRVKEQMRAAHVVTCGSLHHLYDERTMEDVVSLEGGTTDTDVSSVIDMDDWPDIEQALSVDQA